MVSTVVSSSPHHAQSSGARSARSASPLLRRSSTEPTAAPPSSGLPPRLGGSVRVVRGAVEPAPAVQSPALSQCLSGSARSSARSVSPFPSPPQPHRQPSSGMHLSPSARSHSPFCSPNQQQQGPAVAVSTVGAPQGMAGPSRTARSASPFPAHASPCPPPPIQNFGASPLQRVQPANPQPHVELGCPDVATPPLLGLPRYAGSTVYFTSGQADAGCPEAGIPPLLGYGSTPCPCLNPVDATPAFSFGPSSRRAQAAGPLPLPPRLPEVPSRAAGDLPARPPALPQSGQRQSGQSGRTTTPTRPYHRLAPPSPVPLPLPQAATPSPCKSSSIQEVQGQVHGQGRSPVTPSHRHTSPGPVTPSSRDAGASSVKAVPRSGESSRVVPPRPPASKQVLRSASESSACSRRRARKSDPARRVHFGLPEVVHIESFKEQTKLDIHQTGKIVQCNLCDKWLPRGPPVQMQETKIDFICVDCLCSRPEEVTAYMKAAKSQLGEILVHRRSDGLTPHEARQQILQAAAKESSELKDEEEPATATHATLRRKKRSVQPRWRGMCSQPPGEVEEFLIETEAKFVNCWMPCPPEPGARGPTDFLLDAVSGAMSWANLLSNSLKGDAETAEAASTTPAAGSEQIGGACDIQTILNIPRPRRASTHRRRR